MHDETASADNGGTRSKRESVDPDALRYLWEEYKLLQDKIDKIGAFRFQVKGWIVGLLGAALFSAYVGNWPWWSYPLLLAVLGPFWLLEKDQESLSEGFGHRARILENTLRSAHVFSPRRSVPYDRIPDLKRVPPTSPVNAVALVARQLDRTRYGRLVRRAHGAFYVVLLALVLVATVLRFSSSQSASVTSPDSNNAQAKTTSSICN
jgi:hypothetical protein